MRKILYPLLAMVVIAVVVLMPNKKEVSEQTIEREKHFFTGKELRQQEVECKKERRSKGYAKPDKPSEYVKYYNMIRTKPNEEKPGYPMGYKAKQLQMAQENVQQMRSHLKSAKVNLEWKECGPGNVAGRTRGLIIDPDDATANTWFTGSVGGGIWKTTDAGKSWKNLTPDLPNLSTTCIAMAGSNHNVLYAGTGEGFYNTDAIRGNGMYKSTDRGNTWQLLRSTINKSEFSYVNRMVIDPKDENIVVVVTNAGIFKTKDGGATWIQKYTANVPDIIANKNDFNILYAGVKNLGVLKSTDAGESWNLVVSTGRGRCEVAIAPNDPKTVYALNANSQLFVTYDGGDIWHATRITSGSNEKYLGGQGWYNNSMAVSLNDNKELFIGGVNVFKVNLGDESGESRTFYMAKTKNIDSFMTFVDFGGQLLRGGLQIVNENSLDNVSFEIRFGTGKKQKAHRFTVPIDSTTGLHRTRGVSVNEYSYADYIDVPFEVWDTENNRQLMVSFRDQSDDGVFNLEKLNDDKATGREYIFIHNVDYNTTADENIAKTGGHKYKQFVNIWSVLPEGAVWNEAAFPDSKIEFIINKDVKTINVTSKMVAHWAAQGAPYVHADNHNIQIAKISDTKHRIVVANDGGVGYSDNKGLSWINPSNGYVTTQFYGIDKHPTKNRYVGGLQDNGSWVSGINPDTKSQWIEASGGDGFEVVWNASDPDKIITSVYNNSLYISHNGGKNFGRLTRDGVFTDLGKGKAPFITRIGYSVAAPNKIYLIGRSGVTRSEDFGKSWKLSSITQKWGYNGSGEVAVSLNNPEIVWAGCAMVKEDVGKGWTDAAIHVSEDGGKTFKATAIPASLGYITSIATHPTDANTAYVLFSQAESSKILRTTDLGKTWEDISGFNGNTMSTNGFPDVAVYSLLVMPDNPKEIWVGTEIGLFISTDEGKSWHYSDNGLPAVSIWEMKVRGEQVLLATHGRGAWTVNRSSLKDALQSPIILKTGITPQGKGILRYKCPVAYDSIVVSLNDKRIGALKDVKVSDADMLEISNYDNSKNSTVQLIGYKDDAAYYSGKSEILKLKVQEPVDKYETDFSNDIAADFENRGMELAYSTLFSKRVIQSPHPYAENTDLITIFTKPVKVTPIANMGKANIYYNDIPMLEKGEAGAAFGSENFFDYIVVEGSVNGLDWKKIADGYDFSSIEAKAKSLGINEITEKPKKELLLQHKADLLNTFNEGDVILLRFRLHSDAYTAGWGWLIEHLRIQIDHTTAVDDVVIVKTKIYPNPASDYIRIDLGTVWNEDITANIYALDGRLVKSKQIEAHTQTTQYNVTDLKTGNYILVLMNSKQKKSYKIQIVR